MTGRLALYSDPAPRDDWQMGFILTPRPKCGELKCGAPKCGGPKCGGPKCGGPKCGCPKCVRPKCGGS